MLKKKTNAFYYVFGIFDTMIVVSQLHDENEYYTINGYETETVNPQVVCVRLVQLHTIRDP